MGYILDWFQELCEERSFDALNNPEPFSSEKLQAWSWLNRLTLSAFELQAIRGLDRLLLSKKFDKKE